VERAETSLDSRYQHTQWILSLRRVVLVHSAFDDCVIMR